MTRNTTTILASLALLCAALVPGPKTLAQGTRLWTQSHAEDLEHGSPQGVSIASDGALRFGPSAAELLTTPSTFVWGVAQDTAGVIYLATGSPATVLRLDSKTEQSTLFTTHTLAVSSLALGPDGSLYAATMPDGRVYRIDPKATKTLDETSAEVVLDLAKFDTPKLGAPSSESKSRYIWDLTFDSTGHLYAATGGPGAVYRIDLKSTPAKADLFFSTDEAHIRTLAWDKSGNLLAGSDGSGLVYRISPQGKGYVLFSAPRREVTSLAVGPDGTIYAADLGDKSRNPLPQLPIQNGMGITITFSQPGSVQAANASSTVPEGTEIYALKPNQAPQRLWAGKDEVVYRLASTPDGILALTGNRGRLIEIHPDGSSADFAHLDAQQATALAITPSGWLIGTSNTGRLYTLAAKSASTHSYASDVLDAGALSRWGRMEVDPASHGYHLFTRSGNIEQPVRNARDWGWNDWQPVANLSIASPPGRYLQWKAELDPDGNLSGVGVNYLPVNSSPVVEDILVVPGARVTPQAVQIGGPPLTIAFPTPAQNGITSFDGAAANPPLQAQKDRTAVTVRWAAHDDNGYDLAYDLSVRGDGETTWRPLKKSLTDKYFTFDATSVPDGGYQVKVVASDAPSHTPGEALTGELVSDRFELDTTPPAIAALKASADAKAIAVSFTAHDTFSPIAHAEYSLDFGPWQYIEPIGNLSDSPDERYDFRIPLADRPESGIAPDAEHLITVRVYDRHDNMAGAKVVLPAKAK